MSNNSNPTVAAFDFDGTLTTRDCVVPFLTEVAGRTRLIAGMLAQPKHLASGVARRDRDAIKAVAVGAALHGREAVVVERHGSAFAERIRANWMRADTRRRLEWHQKSGHRVVVVSASLGLYLRRVGEMLGLDAVLCTEAEVGADGRFTGRLVGGNCRGPEKLVRFRSWLDANDLGGADTWAYGDSAGDRELLGAARHPVFVKDIDVSAEPATQR